MTNRVRSYGCLRRIRSRNSRSSRLEGPNSKSTVSERAHAIATSLDCFAKHVAAFNGSRRSLETGPRAGSASRRNAEVGQRTATSSAARAVAYHAIPCYGERSLKREFLQVDQAEGDRNL
jgi:hypothetical protein